MVDAITRGRSASASLERAAWSRAFAAVVLVLGLGAATVWWGIILPNGSMGPPGPS